MCGLKITKHTHNIQFAKNEFIKNKYIKLKIKPDRGCCKFTVINKRHG